MRGIQSDLVVFKSTSVPEAAFTAAATDIITSNAHGMVEGDLIHVTTSGADLPAGLAVSTDYYVISPTTNTFKVSATRAGSAVDITDAGTGTHTYHLKGKTIYVGDFSDINLDLSFVTTPTMTVKFQSSNQDGVDFAASQSATNRWEYTEIFDNEDGVAIDGDTGVACAGSADNRIFTLYVTKDFLCTVTIWFIPIFPYLMCIQ